MPSLRRARWGAVIASAACLIPTATVPADAAAPVPHGLSATEDHGRALDGIDPWPDQATLTGLKDGPLTASVYLGIDGELHHRSPLLVRGKNGTFYYGEEIDAACGYGRDFGRSLTALSRLARVIERSGRRVVFTVAPNKSAVNKRDLRAKRLPHGECTLKGIQQQDRTLDGFKDRNYLPMRRTLADAAAAGDTDLYWPIDTHWTRLSYVRWVQALAARLDPKLAKRQSFRRGRETIETDLSFLGLIPETRETGPARFSTTPVAVQAAPGSVVYDPDTVISPVHEWTATPARRVWPGRTLVIGDSFTYRGLDALMPLFRHGQFLWAGQPGVPSVVDAIPVADTVVLEVVQRWLPISPLTTKAFKQAVRRALSAYDAG
jgi:alginate O-acetyltransferase complex protein AlgJ